MIDLARLRGDLPSATMNAYFNAGTFGPLPKPAADAMRAHLEEAYIWGRVGARGYAAWDGLTVKARAAFAAARAARRRDRPHAQHHRRLQHGDLGARLGGRRRGDHDHATSIPG